MHILKNGFTLAEVLITLLIIGVVASIVIPGIVADTQNAEYKAAYKKAFSSASNAWKLVVTNYESTNVTSTGDAASVSNFDAFKSKFTVVKSCNTSSLSQCWPSGELFAGSWPSGGDSFIDSSGMSWCWSSGSWNYIMVDTNGFKQPNKYGRDRFIFLMKANDSNGTGLITKIGVYADFPGVSTTWCPSGGCYYVSWLSQ